MSAVQRFSLVLLLVFCFCDFGSALKCHQCTSYDHSKCGDPFVFEADRSGEKKPKTMEFLKECPNNGTKPYTLCRKIYQNVRGDERIIRGCGYEEYKNECYKTVLEEYNTYVCQCKEDGCNGVGSVRFSATLTFAMASFLTVFFAFGVAK